MRECCVKSHLEAGTLSYQEFRDIELRLFQQLLYQIILLFRPLFLFCGLNKLVPDLSSKMFQVIFAQIPGKVIIQSRQVLLCDLLQTDMEINFLSCHTFGFVILRKTDGKILFVAGIHTHQVLDQFRNLQAFIDLENLFLVRQYVVTSGKQNIQSGIVSLLYRSIFHRNKIRPFIPYQIQIAIHVLF